MQTFFQLCVIFQGRMPVFVRENLILFSIQIDQFIILSRLWQLVFIKLSRLKKFVFMLFKKSFSLLVACCLLATFSFGQVDLINKIKDNQSADAKEGFQFESVIDLETTGIKNQGRSGTCWSYCSNSFLESEMARIGKKPVNLAPMFTVRNVYEEKADSYVRMHGYLNFGQGGALPDVVAMYGKYGAVPMEVYEGLEYGSDVNRHGEMEAILKGMLDAVIANKNKQLSPVWKKAYSSVLDAYLGDYPKEFMHEGKKYTPQTFARDVVGLDASDYIQFTSFNHKPFYNTMKVMVPDNWMYGDSYNVPLNDITTIIDNALEKGYTISWATDVSEKGFSWKNGVAYVPEKDYTKMSKEEREAMFNGPKPEMKVTQENRQAAYDNYTTTDDHGMQIVGLAKDQNGKEYYKVKNSWGDKNDHEGYLYVTKNFVKYKTMTILLHKDAVPKTIRKKVAL